MSCQVLLQETGCRDKNFMSGGTNEATRSSLDRGMTFENKQMQGQCWRTTSCHQIGWRPHPSSYPSRILDASKLATKLCIAVMILMLTNLNGADAFGVTCTYHAVECRNSCRLLAAVAVDRKNNYHHRVSIQLTATMDESSPSEGDVDDPIGEDLDTGGVLIEDLSWRVEKLRLEEQNKKRFLTSGPRFLPYDECRKWVQAWGNRWSSEEDWKNWIRMGEKRNSYIPVSPSHLVSRDLASFFNRCPHRRWNSHFASCFGLPKSRPDEYYGRLGHWISWEHFLGTSPD